MKKPDPFKSAREFAKEVRAKITLPSEPKVGRDITKATDVEATWAKYGPKLKAPVRVEKLRRAK